MDQRLSAPTPFANSTSGAAGGSGGGGGDPHRSWFTFFNKIASLRLVYVFSIKSLRHSWFMSFRGFLWLINFLL